MIRMNALVAGMTACVLTFAASTACAQQRLVSIGGSMTEIVYAIGGADNLVAIDSTSNYPAATAALPKVGYQRTLSAEGLLSVRPDMIVASSDAGPPNVLRQVRDAGVKVVQAASDYTPENVLEKIRLTAALLERPDDGERVAQAFRRDWNAVRDQVSRYSGVPKALFLLDQSGSNSLVAGSHTAADAMIVYSGGINAMQVMQGYKPLTAEAVIAAAPDVLILTSESLNAIGGIEQLLKRPGLALTPAGKNKKIIAMDSLYLLGFGPRLPQAVAQLAEQLHQ